MNANPFWKKNWEKNIFLETEKEIVLLAEYKYTEWTDKFSNKNVKSSNGLLNLTVPVQRGKNNRVVYLTKKEIVLLAKWKYIEWIDRFVT